MASIVGEASSSSPPSASIPPPPPRSCTYDVFLSFSGKDTRNGMTGHLLAALERKGIKTFIDDRDLETGEDMKDELREAIKESMFAVTVFSPNYASSSWCLDELQHIDNCRKEQGLEIVPVFYGVEPWHVRHQKESFGEAFKIQKDRFGRKSKKVRRWRAALVAAANLAGFDFKDKHEATIVEHIAEHIHKKLIPKLTSSTENLVGIVSRVKEVRSLIDIGLNDNVRFIGIWGMSGIGKTTIAEAVYDAIRAEFKVSCFLANVREACEKKQIIDMQKQLLAQANISANTDDEHDIQKKVQYSLRNTKVLLVLDDVNNKLEVKKLAGEQDWFGPGSRIIITTRDIQLLKIYEVHEIYEVQGLADSESFDLFCLKAFKQKKPDEKYLNLAQEVVKYSGGLPLALEVWGSHLCGRLVDVWRDAIEHIKSTPFAQIHDTLKISYNGLGVMEQNIFLDIACFFEGEKTEYVTNVLNKCGYNARICIDILIDRSLVKINEESNVFKMHDLLRDMGRSIVIQESPNNPGKRSRLWSGEVIDLVLQNNKGSEEIQGIVSRQGWFGEHWSADAFSNMTQLKLLIIDSVGGLRDLSSLPTSLKVLHCWKYPLKTLPLADKLQYELVEIKLPFSEIEQVWHGKKFLGKLKHLNLTDSDKLNQTPDLSEVRRLQTLLLNDCVSLTKVHPSVVHHKSLTLLDLTGCRRLEALPGKLEMSSLNELILDHCSRFQNLPEFGKCMKNLSRLSLAWTAIKKLPTSLGCLAGLKDLNLNGCENLECLEFGECMKNLSRLSLAWTAIKKLPTSLGCLVGLEDLNLRGCKKLECLPDITDGIPLLRTLNLSDCDLTEESFLPNFGHFSSLTNLDLSGNDFVSMPINIHDIPKLKCLELNYCNKLRCLPLLPSSIRELEARQCYSLNISEINILSNVCGVSVPPSQDSSQVLLEMVIPGSEIPPWFDHRQDGNSISIPCAYPRNERLGIALCFQLTFGGESFREFEIEEHLGCALVVGDDNSFNTNRPTPKCYIDDKPYIIFLTNDYFSDGFHEGTCLKLSISDAYLSSEVSVTSAARWVRIEDIKRFEEK